MSTAERIAFCAACQQEGLHVSCGSVAWLSVAHSVDDSPEARIAALVVDDLEAGRS
jgi:hypothetical protein